MKTIEYLDQAKIKLNITSDNAFALKIGVTRSAINGYRHKNNKMDDYVCFKIAEILEINAEEIIAAANIEREKNEKKKAFWINFYNRIKKKKGCKFWNPPLTRVPPKLTT
jgi:transcriptional regulator with XRE-family HTH domain